jgi:hypothetical protein
MFTVLSLSSLLGLLTFSTMPQSPVQHRRELLDQLDRASLSALLNTAEANGKRPGRQRAKSFDDAQWLGYRVRGLSMLPWQSGLYR